MQATEGTSIEAIVEARRTSRLSATPVLSLLSASATNRLEGRFGDDGLTRFVREGVNASQIMRNIDDLIEVTTGAALNDRDAERYALEAVSALRDIAIASGDIYAITDATLQLVSALEGGSGDLASGIADVLARIGEPRAQVAIMDRAIVANGDERIGMLEYATESAKRFGNMLQPRQVRWLSERLRDGVGEEATASAGLVGALNLANDAVVDLIVGR